MMHVIPGCGSLFEELESCFFSCFLPALFGVEVSAAKCWLFLLPVHCGGLDVFSPMTMANFYDSSQCSTAFLHKSIFDV